MDSTARSTWGRNPSTSTWPDDELYSAVTLARLLGVPDLGKDLQRHRRRGIRQLTERIQWLITGVVGSPVSAEVEPACEHEVDHLTIGMSLEQARRLTQRLLLAKVGAPSARLGKPVAPRGGGDGLASCRNGPCRCGREKKYEKCCGNPANPLTRR